MRIFLNDLRISFIWKSVIFANTHTNHTKTNKRRTKEQQRTEARQKKLFVVTLPDNTKFYVWWCTGDWWVSCRKVRTEPKPKKQKTEPEQNRPTTTAHWSVMCVRRISQVRDAHSNGEKPLSERGKSYLSEEIFEWFWKFERIFLFPFSVLYGIAWFGVVWYGLHGYPPTISTKMSHRWKTIEILSFW